MAAVAASSAGMALSWMAMFCARSSASSRSARSVSRRYASRANTMRMTARTPRTPYWVRVATSLALPGSAAIRYATNAPAPATTVGALSGGEPVRFGPGGVGDRLLLRPQQILEALGGLRPGHSSGGAHLLEHRRHLRLGERPAVRGGQVADQFGLRRVAGLLGGVPGSRGGDHADDAAVGGPQHVRHGAEVLAAVAVFVGVLAELPGQHLRRGGLGNLLDLCCGERHVGLLESDVPAGG